MKYFKRFLYGLLILFVLFSGFILVCAMKPELSEQVADVLHIGEEHRQVYGTAGEGDGVSKKAVGLGEIKGVISTDAAAPLGQSEDAQQPEKEAAPENISQPDAEEGFEDVKEETDPAISGIKAPENVSGKNGYQPIQDENSQIDDEEARRLQEEIDVGETGEGLDFDTSFYPYYAMLDAQQQRVYRQIYANAMALNKRFAPIEDVSVGTLKNVFAAVYNDHPELFWMDTAYSCKYRRNGQCAEIDLQFNNTAQNLEQEKASFEAKANEITRGTLNLSSNYEKEKYVHDALIAQVDYAASAPMNQSAYSALVNGRTVCAGYARAFQYILQKIGIPCYYCTGYAGENHAWNIVALDDGYYNVDATWDDTGAGTYDYFNKSDADYAGTHLRQNLSVNLPPCVGVKYRNLEQVSDKDKDTDMDKDEDDADKDNKRSLADVGYAPENALTTLENYYNDCYQKMLQAGRGNYTFQNVIKGEALFQDVYGSYQTEDYRQGYMDSVLSGLGATYYNVYWEIETLQDGYYLVTHEVSMQ